MHYRYPGDLFPSLDFRRVYDLPAALGHKLILQGTAVRRYLTADLVQQLMDSHRAIEAHSGIPTGGEGVADALVELPVLLRRVGEVEGRMMLPILVPGRL